MASVDSEEEKEEANKLGWRTFRVRNKDEQVLKNEIICPASKEANNSRICETCKACSGGDNKKASVTIIVHGTAYKVNNFNNS